MPVDHAARLRSVPSLLMDRWRAVTAAAASILLFAVPALAHTGSSAGGFRRRLRPSAVRAGPCGRDGGGRPMGRLPRTARDLASTNPVSAGDGVRGRDWDSRCPAARCRDCHRRVRCRARLDGGTGGTAAAVDRGAARRRIRDLPWPCPRHRTPAREPTSSRIPSVSWLQQDCSTSPVSPLVCLRGGAPAASPCARPAVPSRWPAWPS